MKIFLVSFLFLFISIGREAQEASVYRLQSHNTVENASSVVEVLGTGRGSGVLVLLEGKPVIVTNGHNLQGKKSAMIVLPNKEESYIDLSSYTFKKARIGLEAMVKVLYDFPLSDVAILEIPQELKKDEKALILTYAFMNVELSAQKGWVPQNQLAFGDTVSAVLQGKPTSLKAFDGFMASSVPDTFISGDGNPIWAIPLFAKPGVSGGGYYRNGNLQGLVTKISLAGEPIALATPFTKIAKLIFSNHEAENSVSWDNELMIYKGKNQTIAINPLKSGALGNGGELVEVDDTKTGDSNPDYWRLQIHTMGGNRIITTWAPPVKTSIWSGPAPIIDFDAGVTVDNDGYFSNLPFSTKFSDETIFDLKINGPFLGREHAIILKGYADLSKVTLKLTQDSPEIVLKPQEVNSANSIVFKSDDGAIRVIYLYGNDDLTRLARVYIASEESLIELWQN